MNLVFDYDGTLHDSMKIYAPSFRLCCDIMRKDGEEVEEYYDSEIKHWIGMDAKSMWKEFRPSFSQEKMDHYSDIIGENMVRLINNGRASLYEGAPEILEKLAVYCHLIFLSSCKREYMEAHKRAFELDKYFSEYYCTEDYGFQPKYKIFEHIKKENDYIIIGDRYSDIEVALKHGLKSIGCLYGYGSERELSEASLCITDIAELPEAISSLES